MEAFDVTLRRLTIKDRSFVDGVQSDEARNVLASGLDAKTHALVSIGALIALDAAPQSYSPFVEAARAHGATEEEIVGTLVAAVPLVGAPRVVSAAPKLGLALGYDLEGALEEPPGGAPASAPIAPATTT
jgi:alkylhydroperoxidase/carboxymuconolactone decarboxylase family protein YurZ